MNESETTFLSALNNEPDDETAWLALADWLEESGQVERAELVRLNRQLQHPWSRKQARSRLELEMRRTDLLGRGVLPVVPEVVNAIGMRLALIPAGRFRMGAPREETGRYSDEVPVHQVTITTAFHFGVFPVTQEQYERIMRRNPSEFAGGHRPVERVSWMQAAAFCRRLSGLAAERKAGRRYRLPTEAEWEYACRAGTTTPYYTGADEDALERAGWYSRNSGKRSQPVGSKEPNAWGLYDMHGNVWEWCSDWFEGKYPGRGERTDPVGPDVGVGRVIRGGSWRGTGNLCRSACRYHHRPTSNDHNIGFRVVMVRDASTAPP